MWYSESRSEVNYSDQSPSVRITRPGGKLLTLSSFDNLKNELKPFLYGPKEEIQKQRTTSVGLSTSNVNRLKASNLSISSEHYFTGKNPLKTTVPKAFPPYTLSTLNSPRTQSNIQNTNFLQKAPTFDFSSNFRPVSYNNELRRSRSECKPFGTDFHLLPNNLPLTTNKTVSNQNLSITNRELSKSGNSYDVLGKDITIKGLNGNCFIFEVEKHIEKPLVEKMLKDGPMCFESMSNEFIRTNNKTSNVNAPAVQTKAFHNLAFGNDKSKTKLLSPYSVAVSSSFIDTSTYGVPVNLLSAVAPLYPARINSTNQSQLTSRLPLNVYTKPTFRYTKDSQYETSLSNPSNIHRNKLRTLPGCSYLTGETGKFPSSNVTRGKESDTWSLHKSYAVILPTGNNATDNTFSLMTDRDHSLLESMYKNPNFHRTKSLSPYLPPDYLRPQRGEPQKLFCVRHGERVDSVFGSNWAEQAFDRNGCYQRTNLNMPSTLPRRRNPWKDFFGDSPLTEIGMMQARLTGEALRQRGIIIHYCYSSPAFRCIQTAHNILLGMGIEKFIKIHIEPGIFEFLGWYDRGIPTFLTPEELVDCNFNIDLSYKPTIPLERLSADEKYLDYYNRSYKTAQNITERHKMEGGNILLSGHAATLEVCTRQICGFPPRSYQEFNHVIRKVSFLGLSFCEREKDGSWRLREPPIPHIQHTNNPLFDWKVIR